MALLHNLNAIVKVEHVPSSGAKSTISATAKVLITPATTEDSMIYQNVPVGNLFNFYFFNQNISLKAGDIFTVVSGDSTVTAGQEYIIKGNPKKTLCFHKMTIAGACVINLVS